MAIQALLISLTGISAGLNRKWRGEAGAPRWAWYLFMTLTGFMVTGGDFAFTGIWFGFLLGYALLPWQAMFSVITMLPPGRKDSVLFQWMQTLAIEINDALPTVSINLYWQRFGLIYGVIRATPMIPAVFGFCGYTHSCIPLIGLIFLFLPYFYYYGKKLASHFNLPASMAVPFAEIATGYMIETYMLVCSAQF